MTRGRVAGKKTPRLFKSAVRRLYWKHMRGREAGLLVKGTNRHVIVVRSPDPRVFEEAIFVLRDEYVKERGADQVMEEARRAAADYLRKNGAPARRPSKGLWAMALGTFGALAAGIAWLVYHLAGV